MTKSVVIAGAGQAAAWVARTLRSEGYVGRIVMCGAEHEPPYERPPLSKEQLVSGAPDMPYLIRHDEFPELSVEWKPATSVEQIDRAAKAVVLSNAEQISYDALVIATGGRAHLPPVPGFDLDCVHTLRTLDDARRLRASIKEGRRVLVVGGGWIGLEVAATARQAGASVVLAEMAPSLCARSESPFLSSYLHALHVANGVDLRLDTRVVRLTDSGDGGCMAQFNDGSQLKADLVVVGAGLIPNDEIAVDAGLHCDRGVLVDAAGQSSDPSIYAAGDVAVLCTPDGGKLRLESWQNAQDQGIAVGLSLLGKQVPYMPQPFFWSSQYDALIQMAGTAQAATTWVTRPGQENQQIHIGLDDADRAVYAMCITAPRDLRMLRRCIADAKPLDRQRVADAAVPMAKVALAQLG